MPRTVERSSRPHQGSGQDVDLRSRRRRVYAGPPEPAQRSRGNPLVRAILVSLLAMTCGAGGYLALVKFSPWPPLVTLRHLAALPDCSVARFVGLAPANMGAPGYWPKLDADSDGISCETLTKEE